MYIFKHIEHNVIHNIPAFAVFFPPCYLCFVPLSCVSSLNAVSTELSMSPVFHLY